MEQLNTKDSKANLQYMSIYSVISRRTSTHRYQEDLFLSLEGLHDIYSWYILMQ